MAGGRKEGNGNCFEGEKRMVRHWWKWETCSLVPALVRRNSLVDIIL